MVMMTDLRARLAVALYEGLIDGGMLVAHEREWEDMADHLADVVLSTSGITTVELPEPDDYSQSGRKFYDAGFTSVIAEPDGRVQTGLNQDVPFAYVRKFAAALLAAANAAKEQNK